MLKEALVLAALAVEQPTVTDGDTVKIAGVRIRLVDYDSPELFSPKCPRERMWAEAAKRELEQPVPRLKLELVPCATANYGRLCARDARRRHVARGLHDRAQSRRRLCL